MFTIFAVAKVLAVPVALLLFGAMLLPAHSLYLLGGVFTTLTGLVLLFFSPRTGLILIPAGAAMFVLGMVFLRNLRRQEEEYAEKARESARSASRLMEPFIPRED